MSEKHLTEAPWKALATKKKLKDSDLSKALAAFNKAAEDDHDARLAALDSIEKSAAALKKEHKGDSDVSDYLGNVLTEAGKSRKLVEAAKKQGGGEEDEGSADPAAVKKRMVSLLNRVKTLAPEDPQLAFMACLAGAQTSVLLARSVGATQKKALLEMLPNATGAKYIEGTCIWEQNTHTFVVASVPGGLAQKLQKALLAETGTKYKVRVRNADGSGAIDSDADVDPDSQGQPVPTPPTAPPPPPPPPPPPVTKEQTAFFAQLRTLKPDVDRVIAGKPPIAGEVGALLNQVATLGKAHNYVEAIEGLNRLAGLVKTGLEQMAAATGGADAEGDFRKRFTALVPKIKDAIAANSPVAAELRLRASEASALGKQNSFPQANALLDQIETLLGGGTPSPTTTTPPQPPVTPPPSSPGNEAQAQWNEQFAALEPEYLEALQGGVANPEVERLTTRLRTIWTFATQQAKAGDHAKALAAFKRIESENLFAAIKATKPTGGASSDKVEKLKFLLTRWQEIPPLLSAELQVLKKAIAEQVPEEDADELTDSMDDYLEVMLDEIQDEIDNAITKGDMSILKGLKSRIETDALIQHLFSNPFMQGTKFQSIALDALQEIETKLAA